MITTGFMIGYWLYKYAKNEDATLIEYKPLHLEKAPVYPELTFCIVDPFLDSKLNEIDSGLNKETYLMYLKGEIDLKGTVEEDISYEDISLNLFDYLSDVQIAFMLDGKRSYYNCDGPQNCSFLKFKNTYNGFTIQGHQFIKCFGIEVKATKAYKINLLQLFFYDTFKSIINQVGTIEAMFNHPNQMFIFDNKGGTKIWSDYHDNRTLNFFQINSFEILKRRKKANELCFDEWNRYDELVLLRKIENVGCRTPYEQSYKQFPRCNTTSKMKESMYNLNEIADNVLAPCQEVSHLSYTSSPMPDNETSPNVSFPLTISYPDKIKIITQSQAMDAHALIGNIGGYIGLFLGKFSAVASRNCTFFN